MSESSASTPLDDVVPPTPPPLSGRLGVFGTIDTAVYRFEVVVVVTALAVMSVTVFTDVVYQLAVAISQYVERGEATGWTITAALLVFVGLIAFAATGRAGLEAIDEDEGGGRGTEDDALMAMPWRLAVVGAVIAGCLGGSWALLHLESSTVYRIVLVAFLMPIVIGLVRASERGRIAAFVVAGLVAFWVFGSLPSGYSWAQSYSLVLLLWVGFLGGSIAARERRHLRVDLVRKLLPPRWLPHFNAVSYLAAAAFTALVVYLGYIYVLGPDSTYLRPIWEAPSWLPQDVQTTLIQDFPLPEDASVGRRAMQVFFAPSEPGEIPDWLKVMAIPVSLGLMCIRFIGHAVVFTAMALRGESFNETTGVH